MLRWVPYAIIRIALVFVAGILLGIYHPNLLMGHWPFTLAAICFVLYMAAWWVFRKQAFIRYNLISSTLAFSTVLVLGYTNVVLHTDTQEVNHISRFDNIRLFAGEVTAPAHATAKTHRYRIAVSHVFADSAWHNATGRLYLYVSKDFEQSFDYGDQLVLRGAPNALTPPQNPGEFDYKRFLSFQNIYHQFYTSGEDILDVRQFSGWSPLSWAYEVRRKAADIISTYVPHEREATIAMALILGVKDGLTDDIKYAYSASGAMHVLAVSGLHVGIVYGILLLIFGRLNTHISGRWLLAVLSLLVLWCYAAITGFSPSVLRAVTMFSFVALAKASSRTTNIYNTLCASALVLLLFDPYLIMSVGFQLSYLAVFGIVFLQPKIYSLMAFRWYVLDKIWVITAVSIAAQLATFALGLLYFHQFPTFFLLSNLVVIPGAFIILSGGLLLLLISFWGSAAMVVGWLLQQVIYLVNELVFYIEAWPNSLITNIYITTPETWLIMGGLLCTIMVFVKSKMYYVYYALVFTLLFAASKWQHIAGFQQEEKLIIYRVNGHTALGFIGDGAAWLYTQADLWNNEDKLRFHIRPSLLRAGVSQVNFNALDGEKALQQLEWQGRRLMILREGVDVADLPKGPVDFLLITRGFKENLDAVVEVLKPEMVILDGSLGNYYSSKYAEEADRLNISYHSIYNNGAITI